MRSHPRVRSLDHITFAQSVDENDAQVMWFTVCPTQGQKGGHWARPDCIRVFEGRSWHSKMQIPKLNMREVVRRVKWGIRSNWHSVLETLELAGSNCFSVTVRPHSITVIKSYFWWRPQCAQRAPHWQQVYHAGVHWMGVDMVPWLTRKTWTAPGNQGSCTEKEDL